MDIEKLKIDYNKLSKYYSDFQDEVYSFLISFIESKKDSLDILSVEKRNEGIKKLDSILQHVKNDSLKYKKYNSLIDIQDIAGVRITCHCETDKNIIFDLLEGEFTQDYLDVRSDKKDDHYRAYHLNFAKEVDVDGRKTKIYCELQLRTVLGNAWAVQDTKYIYKKENGEGEPQILSNIVSDILKGCEGLWDLVKEKSNGKNIINNDAKLEVVQKNILENIGNIKSENLMSASSSDDWFDKNNKIALNGLNSLDVSLFMEIKSSLTKNNIHLSKANLLQAARDSQIKTFGWPIGVFLDREEYRPKPCNDGIAANISIKEKSWFDDSTEKISYDYWAINENGSFYLLKSLFEDQRKPGYIFFNTRIVRITETLMYLSNLYSNFGVDKNEEFFITIRHFGLKDKIMGASGNRYVQEKKSSENESIIKIYTTIDQIENNLVGIVKEFATPFFELFDFFSISDDILSEIVINYKNGKIV